MHLKNRIETFAELGNRLRDALDGKPCYHKEKLKLLIDNSHIHNQWFTPENVKYALSAIANELTEVNLKKWTDLYPSLSENTHPVNVGIIMAGNIPLVGFHDFLTVLITGNNLIAKTSSKDSELIKLISEIIISINVNFQEKIKFTDDILSGFDVVIATGSNNSSRYFEYYFGKYPNIIRKNRNSIAIIEGNETPKEIEELGKDIFSFFGLGCRNVSKIYIPKGYDLNKIIDNLHKYKDVIRNIKYANNYDFNKAVYLVNKEKFTDTGSLLIKEDPKLASPVSVLYYEFYDTPEHLLQHINQLYDNIQCIVGKNFIPFGQAQSPHFWDYADGIDTIDFLLKKNNSKNILI